MGEHNLLTEVDCQSETFCADPVQEIPVEKFIKHPEFNRLQKRHDIALIRLSTDALTSRNNIETICLPTDAVNDVEKVVKPNPKTIIPFTISGFGKLEDGRQSDILQMAFVPFVSNAECVKQYEAAPMVRIQREYLCAGGRNKTDTCHGNAVLNLISINILILIYVKETVVDLFLRLEKREIELCFMVS